MEGINSDVIADKEGNSFWVGRVDVSQGAQARITKVDPQGNVVWSKTVGGQGRQELLAVAGPDEGGNLIAGGSTEGGFLGGAQQRDVLISKIDGHVEVRWSRKFGYQKYDYAHAVASHQNGDIFVAGGWDRGTAKPGFVAKYSASGERTWLTELEGHKYTTYFTAVCVDDKGNSYAAGRTDASPAETGSSTWTVSSIIVKGSPEDTELWRKLITDNKENRATEVLCVPGGVLMGGITKVSFGQQTWLGQNDVYVLALNEEGDQVWLKQFGTQGSDWIQGMGVNVNGELVVTSQGTQGNLWKLAAST